MRAIRGHLHCQSTQRFPSWVHLYINSEQLISYSNSGHRKKWVSRIRIYSPMAIQCHLESISTHIPHFPLFHANPLHARAGQAEWKRACRGVHRTGWRRYILPTNSGDCAANPGFNFYNHNDHYVPHSLSPSKAKASWSKQFSASPDPPFNIPDQRCRHHGPEYFTQSHEPSRNQHPVRTEPNNFQL